MAENSPTESPIEMPPTTLGATLMRLGPGMIIAGSIVGSGELIATTRVGAESGFWLLWLIIIGCVVKVFTQIEFGRHTITHSETPLKALDSVPGPRWRVNWVIWYWALMTVLILTQQGGIVGAVGQAMAIGAPITEAGRADHAQQQAKVEVKVELAIAQHRGEDEARLNELNQRVQTLAAEPVKTSNDAALWATIVAVMTAVLLWCGRYGFIQAFSTIMVGGFTLVTLFTLAMLQMTDWAVKPVELAQGLSFSLPPADAESAKRPMVTALEAFGIIGVGAAELIMYPYWCLEKGYAKSTGVRDGSPAWLERARGWMRVLYIDAWASMVVYTFATVAFYLLGAAVLGRAHLIPEGGDMIRTLAQMYVPVFGEWAYGVFLFGAFAVLYSTFFVAAAGNARMVADGLGLMGFHDGSEETRMRWTRVIATVWPIGALGLYLWVQAPAAMVLASGASQAVMLPMLGIAALYFRYRRCDPKLKPGRLWDVMLWVSGAAFAIAGGWWLYSKFF